MKVYGVGFDGGPVVPLTDAPPCRLRAVLDRPYNPETDPLTLAGTNEAWCEQARIIISLKEQGLL